ncbi:MAG TPA: hypothetical protein VIQ76_08760, partial [Propionibacteriaceae bacterium]
ARAAPSPPRRRRPRPEYKLNQQERASAEYGPARGTLNVRLRCSPALWARLVCPVGSPMRPGRQPLVCVVADAQWLDQASAQILSFIGRRLLASGSHCLRSSHPASVTKSSPLPSCPSTDSATAVRALLLDNLYGPLYGVVCDRSSARTVERHLSMVFKTPTDRPSGRKISFGPHDEPERHSAGADQG